VPARLWSISGELAVLFTDRAHRRPSAVKLTAIRAAALAILVLVSPLMLLLSLRAPRATAFDALWERVRQVWETSAEEALALLRSVYAQLVAREAFTSVDSVDIAPYGKFGAAEIISVNQFLYRCEVAFGNYEEAMAVVAALPSKLELTILQRVDCLVALGRRDEAVALLQANLELDGWRGKLRSRLVELKGRHLRSVD